MDEAPKKRPVTISILCVLICLFASMTGGRAFAADIVHRSPLLLPHPIGTTAIVASGVGLWNMRRWCLPMYVCGVLSNLILAHISRSRLVWGHAIVPLLVISIIFSYYRSMK